MRDHVGSRKEAENTQERNLGAGGWVFLSHPNHTLETLRKYPGCDIVIYNK